MKIYISGPMTGLPDKNYPAFNELASLLRSYGQRPCNPAEMDSTRTGWTWEECMRDDIRSLIDCDAIIMLPNWDKSRGAVLELLIATLLDMYWAKVVTVAGVQDILLYHPSPKEMFALLSALVLKYFKEVYDAVCKSRGSDEDPKQS